MIQQGDIWWAELPVPLGAEPGFRRPVVVVQGDLLNASQLQSVVCVPLTSTLTWGTAPGALVLSATATGLPRDSVANASQITALNRRRLEEWVGRLDRTSLQGVLAAIDDMLGRAPSAPHRATR